MIGRKLKDVLEVTVDPLYIIFGGDVGKEYCEEMNRDVLYKELIDARETRVAKSTISYPNIHPRTIRSVFFFTGY